MWSSEGFAISMSFGFDFVEEDLQRVSSIQYTGHIVQLTVCSKRWPVDEHSNVPTTALLLSVCAETSRGLEHWNRILKVPNYNGTAIRSRGKDAAARPVWGHAGGERSMEFGG